MHLIHRTMTKDKDTSFPSYHRKLTVTDCGKAGYDSGSGLCHKNAYDVIGVVRM